ncbi:MAG: FAD-binding protein, partial [Coriobacteriales bacterium]|nr:FAD-binding protein [Coriobacteriales bacterium]
METKNQRQGQGQGNSQQQDQGLSRRNFLKGAALAGVTGAGLAAGSALAGCAETGDAGASGDWLPKAWDYECDLLVIGYGGAGMWASLIGADECGQKVLVLEKAPERGGGNSSVNNGEWAIIEPDKAEIYKNYIRAFTHGQTPDPMIEVWVDEAVRNTEYADKYGVTYEPVEVAIAGSIPEYYFLDDEAYKSSQKLASIDGFGMRSFHELDAKREELGVELMFSCHSERLIQNPQTKEIVGAWTKIGDDSAEKAIKARKGVILTLGGFEFNEDLKNRYLKCYPFKFEGWQFNTGDGIKMVEDVGAKLWHMDMTISMYSMWTRDP